MRSLHAFLFSAVLFLALACKDEVPVTDNFDRKALIENTVDNLLIPSYGDLIDNLLALETAFDNYTIGTTESNKTTLKEAWLEAYLSWQDAALWNFGPAESQGIMSAMNIYPTNPTKIQANIQGTYDLNSISQADAQGFPALEYMLYGGVDLTQTDIQQYFDAVITQMKDKAINTANQWASYRASFVTSTGTDQGSALGQMFNTTFLPYVEVHQREAKFGIPGGQRTGQPVPENVEGKYVRTHSKDLALRALSAYRRAWLGMAHVNHDMGPSVMDYVIYTDSRNNTHLADKLQNQLDTLEASIDLLNNDFYAIAQNNPQALNDIWAKYQNMIFSIKTEISSALNVTISYVDSDGD